MAKPREVDASAPRWHTVRALVECFIHGQLRAPGEVFQWHGIKVPMTGQIVPVESPEMPAPAPVNQPLMGNLPQPGVQVLGIPPDLVQPSAVLGLPDLER